MKNLGFLPIYRSFEFLRLFLMMLLMKLKAIGWSSILELLRSSSRKAEHLSITIV
jgi:hypothetical protein